MHNYNGYPIISVSRGGNHLLELVKDILVTTYGVVLAVLLQLLVDYLKEKASKPSGKHFKRP